MLYKSLILLVGLLSCLQSFAQLNIRDSLISAPMLITSYAYQIPGGDISSRFGGNSNVGIDFLYKTKSNWLFGADWQYMFGGKVKEQILNGLITEQGYIIGSDGLPADINITQRGYSSTLKFGKLFPIIGPNKNSGFG